MSAAAHDARARASKREREREKRDQRRKKMSSKLVKQSLKRAKAAAAVAVANNSSNVGGTMDVSTQNVVRNKTALKKRKKRAKEKREKRKAEEQRKAELMGDAVDEKALSARRRRHLAYFAIGVNDSGRNGEMEKLLVGKEALGKKKRRREDSDDDSDESVGDDDWDVKDLFQNAKKT